MTIAAMKAALEVMEAGAEELFRLGSPEMEYALKYRANTLRAAIAEYEKCEPVAIVGELCDLSRADAIRRGYSVGQYMFTHPAPVPAEREPIKYGTEYESGCVDGWNACREAMLAAAPKEKQ